MTDPQSPADEFYKAQFSAIQALWIPDLLRRLDAACNGQPHIYAHLHRQSAHVIRTLERENAALAARLSAMALAEMDQRVRADGLNDCLNNAHTHELEMKARAEAAESKAAELAEELKKLLKERDPYIDFVSLATALREAMGEGC